MFGLGAVVVVGLGLTVNTHPTPANGPTTTPAAAGDQSAPAPAAADGSAEHPLAFGKTWSPAGKMAVTIGVPAPYTPTSSAFDPAGHSARAVVMDVTITNIPGAPAVPAMAIVVQANAGSSQASKIEDTANNIGTPTTNILPGKALTWKVAFGLPAAQTEFTVQVSTIVGGQTIYFTGTL